eukprot:1084089-Ditylum_brightwellii.AAC.1
MEHDGLNKLWLLLDSQSTMSSMCNGDLVTNIRRSKSKLHMGTYGGETSTDLLCDVSGWGTAWFHPNGMINIIALHEAKDEWRVTYNSKGGNVFKIHKPTHD